MATLPGEMWLIQQIDGEVILFHRHTEQELVRFDPADMDAVAKAQKTIYDLEELDPGAEVLRPFVVRLLLCLRISIHRCLGLKSSPQKF